MSVIDALSTASDLKRTADFARWMSALRLIGAGLVALGVVFEFVGELAGRHSEGLLQASHDVQIERLAERIEVMRSLAAVTEDSSDADHTRVLDRTPDEEKAGGSPSCPRRKDSQTL